MPKKPIPKVFLDANIVIQAGKPPGGPILKRVADLVEADLVSVLTTDLTITEVAKKHAENDYEVVKDIGRPHFRTVVEEVTGVKLPDVKKADIKAKLAAKYEKSTRAMFKTLAAKTLEIDKVKPSAVFSAYAAGQGFFTGEGKKDQFPDAFIFECLRAEASAKEPVIIVSEDGDFAKPVVGELNIELVKSLPALFTRLGLQIEAPEIDEYLEQNKDKLIAAADSELADWGLIGDVEDSYIDETTVTDVEVQELTTFRSTEEGGPILVVGRLTLKTDVSYTHPNWDNAIYDSEDKRAYAFEDVSGETEVSLDVDVALSITVGEDGSPEEIDEFRFRSSDFQYVELHPWDPYA